MRLKTLEQVIRQKRGKKRRCVKLNCTWRPTTEYEVKNGKLSDFRKSYVCATSFTFRATATMRLLLARACDIFLAASSTIAFFCSVVVAVSCSLVCAIIIQCHIRYGFLLAGYSNKRGKLVIAWEVIIMIRKLIIATIAASAQDAYLQILMALLLLVVSLTLQAKFDPYVGRESSDILNHVETWSLFCLVLSQIISTLVRPRAAILRATSLVRTSQYSAPIRTRPPLTMYTPALHLTLSPPRLLSTCTWIRATPRSGCMKMGLC